MAKKELDTTGVLKLDLGDMVIDLEAGDLLIEATQKTGFFSLAEGGVTVAIDTTLTPELIEEGFVREMVSKIQTMRKDADFDVPDHITVYIDGNEKLADIFTKNKDEIMSDVLADEFVVGSTDGHTADWDINGEKVTFGVKKI